MRKKVMVMLGLTLVTGCAGSGAGAVPVGAGRDRNAHHPVLTGGIPARFRGWATRPALVFGTFQEIASHG